MCNVLKRAGQEISIEKESRNSCITPSTSRVKNKYGEGQDVQGNQKKEKAATVEQEKLFIRPPSGQSFPTLSTTTSNSSIAPFVASSQTFTSSLSSSQRLQGDHG